MTQKVEFIESYIKIGNGDYKWNDNHGELIRCKDCKNRFDGCCYNRKSDRTNFGVFVADDWFCADGKRKEADPDA